MSLRHSLEHLAENQTQNPLTLSLSRAVFFFVPSAQLHEEKAVLRQAQDRRNGDVVIHYYQLPL
jgi:hypothetical protein